MRPRLLVLVAAVLLLSSVGAAAVELQPVLSGLTSPLYVTHARDGTRRLFVVAQPGVIKVVAPGAATPTVFLDIRDRVLAGGERGLLGLAFHPQYAANGRFFVNYTRLPDGATVIAEYARSPDPALASRAERVLLAIEQPFENHNGGMIEFGPDGLLYIGSGDGGAGNDPGNRAQNVTDLLGKILRIDVDRTQGALAYGIPVDNPFAAGGGAPEIYAVGLRNPFRFSFDRANGQLLVGDVGQGAWEEIDVVMRGANLGWRVFEGNHCTGLDPALCALPGFTAPVAEYAHGGGRCSVTGGYVYRGAQGALPVGTYVFGDFCSGEIFTLRDGAVAVARDTALAVASFGEDEDGELYVVGLGGTVHRLVAPISVATFVSGLYTSALGRTPGAPELATWLAVLDAQCTASGLDTIARAFFDSPEFRTSRLLSLGGLVDALYGALLGRAPDPAGRAGWSDVFRQARLAVALRGFIPSSEFRALVPDRTDRGRVAAVIARFYAEILQRSPDPAGLAGWVDFVVATGDLEAAAIGFLASPEFETRPLTFRGYLAILYRAFLGRDPDPAGLDGWETALRATFIDVVRGAFLDSGEFQSRAARVCG